MRAQIRNLQLIRLWPLARRAHRTAVYCLRQHLRQHTIPTSTPTTTAAPAAPAAEMTSKRVLKTALFMGSAKTVVPPWGGPPAPER